MKHFIAPLSLKVRKGNCTLQTTFISPATNLNGHFLQDGKCAIFHGKSFYNVSMFCIELCQKYKRSQALLKKMYGPSCKCIYFGWKKNLFILRFSFTLEGERWYKLQGPGRLEGGLGPDFLPNDLSFSVVTLFTNWAPSGQSQSPCNWRSDTFFQFNLTETFTVLASYKTAPHNRYQPHPAEPEQYTKCSNGVIFLLKMGIMMPETCWDRS